MSHKRLINCVIAGTVKAIETEQTGKFGKMRNIQVERLNKLNSFDTIKVMDTNDKCNYEVGEDVELEVTVGARVFGNKAEPKFTLVKSGVVNS